MTTALMADRRRSSLAPGADTLLTAARSEVLMMSSQTVVAPSPLGVLLPINHENLRRGVRYRVLVPDPARTAPGLAPQLAKLARAGAAIRTVPEVPANALFVDRAVAAFPAGHADPGPTASLALIRLPDVVATSIQLFEMMWSAAVPLLPSHLPDPGELDSRERRLLFLLSLGYTDRSAGDELDISVRTVRRMVSAIMNRLGARSRFMAGVKAAERGWLHDRAVQ